MDTLNEDPGSDKPRRRGWFIAFVVVVLVCAGAFAAHRPFIEWWVRREALTRGFQLDFAELSITFDRAAFRQTHVRLVGVSGVDVRFGELVVDLHGLDPIRMQGKEVRVDVTSSVDDLRRDLASFVDRHGASVRLPMTLEGVFRHAAQDHPSVVLSGKTRSSGDGDFEFDGALQVRETKLGTVTMHRTKEGKVDLGFGLTISEKPIVRVSLEAESLPLKGNVTFASMNVDDVSRALGTSPPKGFGGVSVDGSLSFVLDGALPANPHHGSGSFVLNGWVPPHPKELDGIVHGRTTKIGATLELLPDLGKLDLTHITVDAGALHLKGKGNVLREGFSARARVNLDGNIPCSEIGASVVGAHVGGWVGDILRGVTRMGVAGTVKVRVTADVDTKALAAAKLDQVVDMGCRLR